jgi:hypothetical protein
MNYKQIYEQLILRAKDRIIDTYTEKHHIVPKAMGGSNYKSNIVKLTAREHFIAHILLWKIYKTQDMAIAVLLMSHSRGFRINSNEYEKLRMEHAKATSAQKTGNISPMKGKSFNLTPEEKERRSVLRKGKNLGNPGFTGKHKEESIQKMKDIKKGHPPTNVRKITIDNIEYNSIMDASRILNITYNVIRNRIKSEKYPNYFLSR